MEVSNKRFWLEASLTMFIKLLFIISFPEFPNPRPKIQNFKFFLKGFEAFYAHLSILSENVHVNFFFSLRKITFLKQCDGAN